MLQSKPRPKGGRPGSSSYNSRMTFLDMLRAAERQNASMLCVGLDPEPTRFPAHYSGDASKIYDFCAGSEVGTPGHPPDVLVWTPSQLVRYLR